MTPADTLWRLLVAGVVTDVPRACEVIGVSKHDLNAARARFECPTVPRPPTPEPAAARPSPARPLVSSSAAVSRHYSTPGRARAARRAFADLREWVTLRVESPKCTGCGEPILSGDVAVIERAHHQGCSA